jgi:hypothetical protein
MAGPDVLEFSGNFYKALGCTYNVLCFVGGNFISLKGAKMGNHKMLMFCMVLATASLVGLTLWAQDMSSGNMANMANNAANMTANTTGNLLSNEAGNYGTGNLGANATGNISDNAMSNADSTTKPAMTFRQVNQSLTTALKDLDDASKANDSGDKDTVSAKIADARKQLTSAQEDLNSWNRNMFSGNGATGNASSNIIENQISNATGNTP